MKTLSKVLCLLMVAVMCMSFFGASASAFSINIGGSGSSSTGSINIPMGASEDDEAKATPTPAPKATPAVDAGFGAGEPDVVDDEGFNAEMDLDETDNTAAVAAVAKAIEDGQTVIKFNGYFSFLNNKLEITKNVTFSLSEETEIEEANNIVVKNGATLSITGSGNIDVLPTVEEGGKLLIYGCMFDEEIPSKYVADGYKVEVVDNTYYKVVKETVSAPVDETKDEKKPEDEEASVYLNPEKAEDKTIVLNSYVYVKNSGIELTAAFDTDANKDGNLGYFFMVKSNKTTVTDENLISDAYFEIKYVGTKATLIFKNEYLDKLEPGLYWFGGIADSNGRPDNDKVKYAAETLEIKNQELPSTGDAKGGLKVSIFEKSYFDNGGWESGDGALHFYCKYNDNVKVELQLLRVEIDDMDHKANYELDNEMWYDQGSGYFFVGESQFLNKLSKGVHTLKVYAKDSKGTVYSGTCDFLVLQDPAPTLEFSGTHKHVVNSGKSLKLKSSEPIKAVYAGKNGTKLDNFDYTMYKLSSDGKTLTLTPEFLNARAAGYSYALWVEDASGNESNTVYFQILTTAQANASVDTGDASDIALWAAFLILSGAAVAVALPKVKKNGGKE